MQCSDGDLQAGGLGLGGPQVDEALAQRRVVEQVGAAEDRVTFDMWTGSISVGLITSPPSSPSSITTIGPSVPVTPPTKP